MSETFASKLLEASRLIKRAMDTLNGGPLEFYLENVGGANKYMMDRFCPLNIGDDVALVTNLDIPKDHGWYPFRGMVKQFAVGTVTHRECGPNGFTFDVQFLADPATPKYSFRFRERDLVKLPTRTAAPDAKP